MLINTYLSYTFKEKRMDKIFLYKYVSFLVENTCHLAIVYLLKYLPISNVFFLDIVIS